MIKFEGNNSLNKKVTKLMFEKFDNILPSEEIKKMLERLSRRAGFEIPETGTFRVIEEKITNHKPVISIGDVSLSIKPTSSLNSSTERSLQALVKTKSGFYQTEQVLAKGSREDILKYINDENFNQNFKRFLMECSENFEKQGLE